MKDHVMDINEMFFVLISGKIVSIFELVFKTVALPFERWQNTNHHTVIYNFDNKQSSDVEPNKLLLH